LLSDVIAYQFGCHPTYSIEQRYNAAPADLARPRELVERCSAIAECSETVAVERNYAKLGDTTKPKNQRLET